MVKILYVDDELLNLKSFELLFRNEFVVLTATSGEMALKIIEENEIDVIISDQKMPYMSGVELLEKVARNNFNTLRIIHSGLFEKDEMLAVALKNKVADFCLDKPLDEDRLREIINIHLSKK